MIKEYCPVEKRNFRETKAYDARLPRLRRVAALPAVRLLPWVCSIPPPTKKEKCRPSILRCYVNTADPMLGRHIHFSVCRRLTDTCRFVVFASVLTRYERRPTRRNRQRFGSRRFIRAGIRFGILAVKLGKLGKGDKLKALTRKLRY